MSDLISSIKHLRELTGVGYLDCKEALKENNNDVEKSIDFLRKKGLAKASKKSSREVNEGAIGVYLNDTSAIMIEINTETDFAARNEVFLDFINQIGEYALKIDNIFNISIDDFLKKIFDGRKISEYFINIIEKIGENIVLRRLETMKFKDNTCFSSYVHGQVKSNLGKIGVIIAFKCDKDCEEVFQLGKQIAMHVAASKPIALSIESVDKNLIEREKKILFDQAKSSGKPEKIINQMVMGRVSKFYNEIVLMEQAWVMDGETKLSKIIKNFENDKKCNFIIKDFKYFVLGEGIELDKKDFVSEVAEQANK